MTTGLLISAITVLAVVVIIVIMLLVRAMMLSFAEKVAGRLGMEHVFLQTTKAVCAGTVKGRGMISRSQGNCGLALAKSGIVWIPIFGEAVTIEYNRITETCITKKHGGKAQMSDMLAVAYTSRGEELRTAWVVPDAVEWKTKLEEQWNLARKR